MKSTQYRGELFIKNDETCTRFVIGTKVVNSRIERLVIALGGNLIKTTKNARYYEIKGDKINLCLL